MKPPAALCGCQSVGIGDGSSAGMWEKTGVGRGEWQITALKLRLGVALVDEKAAIAFRSAVSGKEREGNRVSNHSDGQLLLSLVLESCW